MSDGEVEIDEYERPTFWLYTGVDETFYNTRIKYVLELLEDPSNMSILDIGCGDGRSTYELSKHAKNVVGIDPVERAIDFARILGKKWNKYVISYYRCREGVRFLMKTEIFTLIP